jgi:hypothetical protein
LSKSSGGDPSQIDRRKPVVYFGSFQDLLDRDNAGNIKAKNEWIHTIKGLPFTRAAQGIQYRTHESGRVCIPAI